MRVGRASLFWPRSEHPHVGRAYWLALILTLAKQLLVIDRENASRTSRSGPVTRPTTCMGQSLVGSTRFSLSGKKEPGVAQ